MWAMTLEILLDDQGQQEGLGSSLECWYQEHVLNRTGKSDVVLEANATLIT